MLDIIRGLKQLKKLIQLSKNEKNTVFYSEGHTNSVHFEHIINHLVTFLNQIICYLTSQSCSLILKSHHRNIIPIYGESLIRKLYNFCQSGQVGAGEILSLAETKAVQNMPVN